MKFSVFQLSRRGGRPTNEDRMGYCYTREAGAVCAGRWHWEGTPKARWPRNWRCKPWRPKFQRQATPRLPDVQAFLQQGVMLAHERILAYGRHKRMSDGPRTTVVAAVIQDGHVSWVNCGDSRLYWARDGVLQARTRDHSYAEIDPAGALKLAHKILNRNVLYTCLGAEARPVLDFSGPHKLQQNDRLLLCSDGLWDVLQEHILLQRLSNSPVQDVRAGPGGCSLAGGRQQKAITSLPLPCSGSRRSRSRKRLIPNTVAKTPSLRPFNPCRIWKALT